MEVTVQRPILGAAATLVGSFPHTEPQRLIERIFTSFPKVPAWPQMPVRDWRESMYVQYSEGLPGAMVDQQGQRIHFRAGEAFQIQLEDFYQAVVEGDVEPFAITEKYALGLHVFLDMVPRRDSRPRWVKGQVTGPFSFAMTVTDENKRSMAYNPELYEVAVHGMAMKARWMARKLREVADGVLVVLDEPYLCSFGSAFVNVPRSEVIAAIGGAVTAIHKEGALAGLHCCGNTDWALVLTTGVDVLNFDACDYFQGLSLYPTELKSFLERGGTLSWGIVPANGAADDVSANGLLSTLDNRIEQLAAKGIDRGLLFRQALLTPSCGLGTRSVKTADRLMDVLVELSDLVRQREQLA